MRIFSIILISLFTTSLYSQTFTVSGRIIDATNNPVAYTNILLLKASDSTIVSGTTSDEEGVYLFDDIVPNTYILKASFISYKDNYSYITVNSNTVVPALVLEESIETLSEVELVYRKPTLKREVDRLVFNVEKTALSEGNLMEVLRNTPSVLVMDDAITVKGSEPTVYINDRKVHISSSEIVELLQGTSASNIKSVEVITNPPARYDAESGVVLNIVMAKNLVSGYNGSVFSNATQGVFTKFNHGMSNYFKGKNVSLFANYSYNDKKEDRVDLETIDFPTKYWESDIDRNTWSETHNLNVNFDWDVSDKTTVSFSTNTQLLPYFKYVTKSNTQIFPVILNDVSRFRSFNLSKDKKQNLGFDFDIIHNYDSGAKLSFNSHYTTYDYRRKQNVTSDYFLGDNSFSINNTFRTRSDQDTEILTSQVDYVLPLGEASTFEIGAKFSNVISGSDIKHYDLLGGSEVLNNARTDTFDYDEKVYAAYLSYETNSKKWSLSTGLRLEQTNIESLSAASQTNNQDYLEWFPTVNIGFQASEKISIYTNYKRSIDRPSYSYLNPFRFYLNDNTYVTGNPELKPVFIDQYKFGISFNNMFVIESYYKKYDNNIFELPIQDNINNTLAHTSLNIDYTEEIGIDFEAYFNVIDRWTIYFGTSFYSYKDYATIEGVNLTKGRWSNYTIFQNNFSLLKDNSLTASLNLDYAKKNVQGLQLIDSRLMTNISLRKTILKGKGSLSLIVSDLFNKEDFTWTTKFADQNNTTFVNLDNRYVKLGFRYRFGNTKLSTNERTTSIDERDRLNKN